MLEFQSVSAGYRKKTVLKNISFTIRSNRITAVIGRNGCGKSTMLGCVNGASEYTGKILLDGEDLQKIKPRERAKRICVLPQILPVTSRTVYEMLEIGRSPYASYAGALHEEDERMIRRAADIAGVESFLHRSLSSLSGGERQKAYIAMALAQNTEWIFADEATTFMDSSNEAEFFRLAEYLRDHEQKSIVLVTHSLYHAVNEADDILLLKNGEVVFFGESEKARDSNVIETEFAAKKHIYTENGKQKVFYT